MSSSSVGSFRSKLEAVRESLRESHLNALRNTLRDSDILEACREDYELHVSESADKWGNPHVNVDGGVKGDDFFLSTGGKILEDQCQDNTPGC